MLAQNLSLIPSKFIIASLENIAKPVSIFITLWAHSTEKYWGYIFFLLFQKKKKDLEFHANCQIPFSEKSKNITSLSSAELAQRVDTIYYRNVEILLKDLKELVNVTVHSNSYFPYTC